MAYTTDAVLLQSVRDAITGLIEGRAQSYTINMGAGGSRSVTKLDLKELREMENDLIVRVDRATRGSSFGVAAFRSAQ